MYKLLNLVFGWDYIQWKNTAASGIARVRVDYNGNVYYWQYKPTNAAGLITDHKPFLWLTCPPAKYLST